MSELEAVLRSLGISYSVETLAATGNLMLSIEDMHGMEVQFVFGRHGDEIGDLRWWEVWKR